MLGDMSALNTLNKEKTNKQHSWLLASYLISYLARRLISYAAHSHRQTHKP